MGNELDRPLGMDGPAPRIGGWRFGWRGFAACGTIAVIFAASFYTALVPVDGMRPAGEMIASEHDSTDVTPDPRQTATVPSIDQTTTGDGTAGSLTFDMGDHAAIEQTLFDDGSSVTMYRPGGSGDGGPRIIENERGQNLRVAHLPDERLIEETDFGTLPKTADDGTRPLDVYGRAWSGARGARIAIVVGGLGLSQTGTMNAIDTLPEEVTLAFAASGNSLQRWVQEARRGGHEVLLQVPFEPFGYPQNDPGPGTLLTGDDPADTVSELRHAMARITNYSGLVNYMGGRFLADMDALEPVLREVAARGLLFLDDGSSAQSQAGLIARTIGAPFAAAELQLDADRDHAAILARLDALERSAVRNGQAIGIASAFDISIAAIAEWAEAASERNIEIVGVSALVDGAPAN